MKKVTLLLVAFILVCTSAFASFSFTVGGGVISKTPLYEDHERITGPAFLVGLDVTCNNGLTIYDDFNVGFLQLYNPRVVFEKIGSTEIHTKEFYSITEKLGAGYTFDKDDWAIMVGGGLELQALMVKHGYDKEHRLGIGPRIKATYSCTDKIGLSLQLDPTLVFKSEGPDTFIDGAEFSANALVGFTFKY